MKKRKKNTDEMSAVETILNWNYNPSVIENRVDEKPLSSHEKELIESFKY